MERKRKQNYSEEGKSNKKARTSQQSQSVRKEEMDDWYRVSNAMGTALKSVRAANFNELMQKGAKKLDISSDDISLCLQGGLTIDEDNYNLFPDPEIIYFTPCDEPFHMDSGMEQSSAESEETIVERVSKFAKKFLPRLTDYIAKQVPGKKAFDFEHLLDQIYIGDKSLAEHTSCDFWKQFVRKRGQELSDMSAKKLLNILSDLISMLSLLVVIVENGTKWAVGIDSKNSWAKAAANSNMLVKHLKSSYMEHEEIYKKFLELAAKQVGPGISIAILVLLDLYPHRKYLLQYVPANWKYYLLGLATAAGLAIVSALLLGI